MLSNSQAESLRPRIRTMQLIVAAMMIGVLFTFFLLMSVREAPRFTRELDVLTLIGLVPALSVFSAIFFVQIVQNKLAVKNLGSQFSGEADDPIVNKAAELYQTNLIIRVALIEGTTFLNVLLYFITGSVFNAGVVGLGVVMLGLQLPTFGRVIANIDGMIDSAKREKQGF